MVGMTGFEPATSSSRTTRSTKLSHIPTLQTTILPDGNQTGLLIIAPDEIRVSRKQSVQGPEGDPFVCHSGI